MNSRDEIAEMVSDIKYNFVDASSYFGAKQSSEPNSVAAQILLSGVTLVSRVI